MLVLDFTGSVPLILPVLAANTNTNTTDIGSWDCALGRFVGVLTCEGSHAPFPEGNSGKGPSLTTVPDLSAVRSRVSRISRRKTPGFPRYFVVLFNVFNRLAVATDMPPRRAWGRLRFKGGSRQSRRRESRLSGVGGVVAASELRPMTRSKGPGDIAKKPPQ